MTWRELELSVDCREVELSVGSKLVELKRAVPSMELVVEGRYVDDSVWGSDDKLGLDDDGVVWAGKSEVERDV